MGRVTFAFRMMIGRLRASEKIDSFFFTFACLSPVPRLVIGSTAVPVCNIVISHPKLCHEFLLLSSMRKSGSLCPLTKGL